MPIITAPSVYVAPTLAELAKYLETCDTFDIYDLGWRTTNDTGKPLAMSACWGDNLLQTEGTRFRYLERSDLVKGSYRNVRICWEVRCKGAGMKALSLAQNAVMVRLPHHFRVGNTLACKDTPWRQS